MKLTNKERDELQNILIECIESPTKIISHLSKLEDVIRTIIRRREEKPPIQNAKANKIILDVCTHHQITLDQLRGTSRSKQLIRAREDAIEKLYDSGFTYNEITSIVNRHSSTVNHTLHRIGKIKNGATK